MGCPPRAPEPYGDVADARWFAHVRFAPSPATVARIGRNGSQLLLAGGEATGRLGPRYDRSGGWLTRLQMAHQAIDPTQFLDAVLRDGIEHHYASTSQDVTDALTEFASCHGLQVSEPPEVYHHIEWGTEACC